MKRLVNALSIFVMLVSGLAIAGTLASSPNATSELGLPTISFGTKRQDQTDGPALIAWPKDTHADEAQAHESLPFKRTIGLVVAKRSADNPPNAQLWELLGKRHTQTKPAQQWTEPLLAELRQTAGVQFAWLDALPMQDNILDLASCQQQIHHTQTKVTEVKELLKLYEIETAVLTDQLTKQWAERLLRQSTEDMQTLTLMRARAEQDVRIRLARSGFDDARIRLEGLSSVEQVRLAYLSSLNRLLADMPAATLLPILEEHSVFTQPAEQTQHDSVPTTPKSLPKKPKP